MTPVKSIEPNIASLNLRRFQNENELDVPLSMWGKRIIEGTWMNSVWLRQPLNNLCLMSADDFSDLKVSQQTWWLNIDVRHSYKVHKDQ